MAIASCHFCMINIDQYSFVLISLAVFDELMCFFKCDVEPSCNWWTNKNQRQWKLLFFSSRNLELTLDCVMLVKPYKKSWNRMKLNLMERLTKVWFPRASKNLFVCCCCSCFYLSVWQFSTPIWKPFGFSPWFLTCFLILQPFSVAYWR